MAAKGFDEDDSRATALQGAGSDETRPFDLELYRAWIATKLFQGLGLVALLVGATLLFDSW